MSPKMRYLEQRQEYALLLAKCLFCPDFADCLIEGNYVLFVTRDNMVIETNMSIVYLFTQSFR
jgi:hypothetical protein